MYIVCEDQPLRHAMSAIIISIFILFKVVCTSSLKPDTTHINNVLEVYFSTSNVCICALSFRLCTFIYTQQCVYVVK